MNRPVYSSAMNDDGFTYLPGGLRVPKTDTVICALGALDELNAALGLLRVQLAGSDDNVLLESIQRNVLEIGGELSTGTPRLSAEAVATLEQQIAQHNADLPPLREFVLPGATELSARLHWARAICRRAERDLVRVQETSPERVTAVALQYLNRLSGFLFALVRIGALKRPT